VDGKGKNIWDFKRIVENTIKKVDVPLQFTLDLVIACICQYNLCIWSKNNFNTEWATKTLNEGQMQVNLIFGNINTIDLFNVT